MNSSLFGFFGVIFTSIFFGSCYVPMKRYKTYDGVVFQWFQCSGIFTVGIIVALCTNDWGSWERKGFYVSAYGLVGGCIWSVANVLASPVLQILGLGLGFVLWNWSNILIGFCIGHFGLFGVNPEHVSKPALNIIGLCIVLASLGFMLLLKPDVDEIERSLIDTDFLVNSGGIFDDTNNPSEVVTTSQSEADLASKLIKRLQSKKPDSGRQSPALARIPDGKYIISDTTSPDDAPYLIVGDINVVNNFLDFKKWQAQTNWKGFSVEGQYQKLVGCILAIILGLVVGNALTPFLIWKEDLERRNIEPGPFDFVFSQTLGIYMTSSTIMLFWGTGAKMLNKNFPKPVLRPAFLSGIMWGLGFVGQIVSTSKLPFIVAYPLTAIGPVLCSTLWSIFYFREIQGRTNQQYLSAALFLMIVGITLIALSEAL